MLTQGHGEQVGLKVLGATLEQLLSSDMSLPGSVPFWIKYSCKAMLAKRVVDEIPKLLANIENGAESLNVRPYSALTIGRLLVLYFKKLPTPLLTFELHDQLIGAAQLEIFENSLQRLQYLCDVLRALPAPNYYTLGKLLRVFAKVWKEQNKDTQKSTIEIWGPILLLRENVHDMTLDLPWACHLLRILIENQEFIYPRRKYRMSLFNDTPVTQDQVENVGGIGKALRGGSSSSSTSSISINMSSLSLAPPSMAPGNLRGAPTTPRLSLAWLGSLNVSKVTTMESYLAKMEALIHDMATFAAASNLEKDSEIGHCMMLAVVKSKSLVESLSLNPKSLTRLIDSYHLERCHSYVVDLHTSLIKHQQKQEFLSYFTTRSLNATLQRLYLSLQHELSLFFTSVDNLLGGSVKTDPRNHAWFKVHTIDLINHVDGKLIWMEKCGLQTFAVPWEFFIKQLLAHTEQISLLYNSSATKQAVISALRMVFDDAMTGVVTVFKFARFLDGFGDLSCAAHTCYKLVSQPYFHGYVSRKEATRLLEPYATGTFLIRFSTLGPSSFAINFKDDNHQLYNIQVDVVKKPLNGSDATTTAATITTEEANPPTPRGTRMLQRKPSFRGGRAVKLPSTAALVPKDGDTSPSSSSPATSTPGSPTSQQLSKAHSLNSSSATEGLNSAPSSFKVLERAESIRAESLKIPTKTKLVYTVKEGDSTREFEQFEEMIDHYSDFLSEPLTYKLLFQPWFYGEFSASESQQYLQHEPIGTFLVRFSSHHAKLTLDYVSEDGRVIQHRLERTPDSKIASGTYLYEDIDHFVSDTKGLKFAYKHDNQVSTTREEDDVRRHNTSFVNMLEDQEVSASHVLLTSMSSQQQLFDDSLSGGSKNSSGSTATGSTGSTDDAGSFNLLRSSSGLDLDQTSTVSLICYKTMIDNLPGGPLGTQASQHMGPVGPIYADWKRDKIEEVLTVLLYKRAQGQPLKNDEKAQLHSLSFHIDMESFQAIQTKVHAKITDSTGLLKRRKGALLQPHGIVISKVKLFNSQQYDFKIKNRNKVEMRYTIQAPQPISSLGFLALSSRRGILKPGQSQTITLTIVMFKPCVIRETLIIRFQEYIASTLEDVPSEDAPIVLADESPVSVNGVPSQTYSFLLTSIIDNGCLENEAEVFWQIPDEFLLDIKRGNAAKKLGAGAAATVWLARLYGVPVAAKVWELGSKNMPPPDFVQELAVMTSMRHPNLVRFIGAISKQGMACLVMEFINGGSLDKFWKFRQPCEEDMQMAAAAQNIASPASIVTIRNLNLSNNPNLSVLDPANGSSATYKVHLNKEDKSFTDASLRDSASQGMIPPDLTLVTDILTSNMGPKLAGISNFSLRIPIALDIAKALLYLHERNLIHRDVKSLNVLINTDTLHVSLSDFGEAATKDASRNESVGSTPWMAPEVCLSQVYSTKADVFSFGLVLYEILVEGYPVRTLMMIAEGLIPVIPPKVYLAFPAYVRLIHACTLQNPDKRPTMFSVVRELEKIQSTTHIRKVRMGKKPSNT